MLLSSKAQGCKDFWKPSKSCHVGIHWIALAEYSQMSTYLPGFPVIFQLFVSFWVAKLDTSSIRVNPFLSGGYTVSDTQGNTSRIEIYFEKYCTESGWFWSVNNPSSNNSRVILDLMSYFQSCQTGCVLLQVHKVTPVLLTAPIFPWQKCQDIWGHESDLALNLLTHSGSEDADHTRSMAIIMIFS